MRTFHPCSETAAVKDWTAKTPGAPRPDRRNSPRVLAPPAPRARTGALLCKGSFPGWLGFASEPQPPQRPRCATGLVSLHEAVHLTPSLERPGTPAVIGAGR